jgi:hypothetical protein
MLLRSLEHSIYVDVQIKTKIFSNYMPSFIEQNCIFFSLLYLQAYIGCRKYKNPGRSIS